MSTLPEVIMLCGFSGSGKTETGRRLSEKVGYLFTDTDAAVEAMLGKSILDIFRELGETRFRAAETDVFHNAVKHRPHIISLGGGTIANNENLAYAKANGYLIYLRVSPATAANRLRAGSPRPMLNANNSADEEDTETTISRIKQLLELREIYYCQAELAVDTEGRSPEEVADEIIRSLRHYE
jgi:shikimate kinase